MQDSPTSFAVLMDAGAVFFAVRDLYEGLELKYPKLAQLLSDQEKLRLPDPRKRNDPNHIWAMWTSFHPQNTGQARFIESAEKTLGWVVRRFPPSESYMLDPQTALSITSTEGRTNRMGHRLMRFDASIAYMLGRIADTHDIVLVTDSFTLAEPLARAARLRGRQNTVAFFGRLLDSRWQAFLRGDGGQHVKFIDFDNYDTILFDTRRQTTKSTWEEDFPVQ